jgi:hypothetical protein
MLPGRLRDVLVGAQGLLRLSGEHVIAFKCWSDWSDDVPFVWLAQGSGKAAEQSDEADKP